MDADSSYGGSDTAQDSTLGHDSNSLETTIPNHTGSAHDHHDSSSHQDEVKSVNSHVLPSDDTNSYYKNEVTLPVNYDETDHDKSLPHYMSTAKLNIEESLENHNNLDELSKNYSSTHNLNPETPKSRKKSTAGIDNPAYQEDETKTPATNGALKSTFDEKKAYNNGDLNSTLGLTSPTKHEEPMSEAVNLELINLKPTGKDVVGPYENGNGISDIPVKKETEVEIGNPYDEYFVPVNEHRKYMSSTRKGRNSVTFAESVAAAGVDDTGLSLTTPERGVLEYPDWLTALENPRGEKLYVTKDKRDKKKRNKCLCWGLCLAVVAAAVIVGILAAVGIIGSPEAHPVQEARHFGDSPKQDESDVKSAGGFFGVAPGGDSTPKLPDQTSSYPLTPEPPISTPAGLLPTTDTSIIEVPRALESQLVIDNLQFSPDLAHRNSTEFRNLADILERELKSALFSNYVLQYGGANIELKVTEFMPGSVVVKFRVGWEFKDGIHNPKDPIDKATLEQKLRNTLERNYGYIYEYHIPESTVTAAKIINMCQIDKNGCEHTCSFDYNAVNFKCECPPHQHLAVDEKTCIDLPMQPEAPSTEHETVTDFEFIHVHQHQPEAEPQPTEPSAVPEPSPSPEPTAQPEPEPTAEPTAQPEPQPSAEPTVLPIPQAEPTVQPEPQPSAEPTAQPEPIAEPTPEPQPQPEPGPTTKSEMNMEPQHTTKLDYEVFMHDHMTTFEPSERMTLQTTTKSSMSGREGKLDDGEQEAHVEHATVHESSSEPQPTSEPVPTARPEPTTQSELHSSVEPTVRPALYPFGEATTQPEPQPSAEPTVQPEPQPSAEPTTQPEPQPSAEPTIEPEPRPSAEPTPQPEPQPSVEPTVLPEPQPSAEPTVLPEPQPSVEPTVQTEPQPSTDSTVQPEPQPTAQPELRPSVEPTVQPEPQPSAEPTVQPEPQPSAEPTAQPSAEPTAQPSAEPTAQPEPQPSAEPTTQAAMQSSTESTGKLEILSSTEPVVQPEVHLVVETTVRSEPLPSTEPTTQPASQPSVEATVQPEPQPSAEPTVQPTMQLDMQSSVKTTVQPEQSSTVNKMLNIEREVPAQMGAIPSGEMHTTLTPESTTLQSVSSNESKISFTTMVQNAVETTVSPKAENEIITNKAEVGKVTEHAISESISTPLPEQDTHEETLRVSNVIPLEETPIQTTPKDLQLQFNDIEHHNILTEKISIDEPTTTSAINAVKDVTTKPEPQITTQSSESVTKLDVNQVTTIASQIKEVEDTSKNATEIVAATTQTSYKQDNLIPIEINSQTEMVKMDDTTTQTENSNLNIIPITINNETHLINTETSTYVAKEQSNSMQETTTEIHKSANIEDHSTENIILHTTHETHQHMVTYDPTENSNVLDNMSPFLPEIENDTLVNILHADVNHHIDMNYHHNETEMHDENMFQIPEKPPRLDNDEMNVTNPQDPSPTDTTILGVIPLQENATEKSNEILSNHEITTQPIKEVETTQNEFLGRQFIGAAAKENDNETQVTTMKVEHTTLAASAETTTSKQTDVISESHETTTLGVREPTLSPDIINNVHSNNYFLNLQSSTSTSTEQPTEIPQITTLQPEQSSNISLNNVSDTMQNVTTPHANFSEINTSTEDLVALETTTSKLNEIKEENITNGLTSEASNLTNNATTIHAEAIDTVTETVDFSYNSSVVNTSEATNVLRNNVTNFSPAQNDSEATAVVTQSAEKTHQYEVHENLSEDLTTARGNLLPIPSSTEAAIIETLNRNVNDGDAPLPVIPLKDNEDDATKDDKKRADDESFNKLDLSDSIYDSNDSLNDISDEEKSVLDKFVKEKSNEKTISSKSVDGIKPDIEHEKDHYIATDFTDKATFTSSPSKKNYLDEAAKEFYGKTFQSEKATTELHGIIPEIDGKNATETILFDEVKPVTEGYSFSGFSRCASGQFQCVHGTAIKGGSYCISSNDQCDSVDDCTDASDEVGCEQEKCRDNFQCASGQCLKRNLVCDGIIDCNDRSDEQNCESWQCRFDEFSCGTGGRCIPISQKCDGLAQCPGGEDEYQCHSQTCNNNTYHCVNQDTCIPASWRCDGKQDCAEGDDETSCECTADQFRCTQGGGCIPVQQRCDGIQQCADLSDEWNCLRLLEPEGHLSNPSYLEVLSKNQTWLQVCSDSWNSSYSDMVCQSLGYAGSISTDSVKGNENSTKNEFYKLKLEQQYGMQLLSQLERTDKCETVVSITCQDFACGSHAAVDVESARMFGGSTAVESQWPSLALLHNKKNNRQCTATLIAPRWVMASHLCVFSNEALATMSSSSDWVLYSGGTNFFNNADNSSTQVRLVTNIIAHPQTKYSQFVYTNDIVLVELKTPLSLGQNVSTACLPNSDIEPRQLCVTAGWGVSKPGDIGMQQYLHYLPVPTIDMDECNSTKHYNGRITKDKICAGYSNSDKTPCYNDEGAPLLCFSHSASTWEVHGLLSYHANCGRNHHPALYSSINEDTRQWISNTIGLKPVTNQRVALNKK